MQRVQDKLDFKIETPTDVELARRYANRQQRISAELARMGPTFTGTHAKPGKPGSKKKSAKKLAGASKNARKRYRKKDKANA